MTSEPASLPPIDRRTAEEIIAFHEFGCEKAREAMDHVEQSWRDGPEDFNVYAAAHEACAGIVIAELLARSEATAPVFR